MTLQDIDCRQNILQHLGKPQLYMRGNLKMSLTPVLCCIDLKDKLYMLLYLGQWYRNHMHISSNLPNPQHNIQHCIFCHIQCYLQEFHSLMHNLNTQTFHFQCCIGQQDMDRRQYCLYVGCMFLVHIKCRLWCLAQHCSILPFCSIYFQKGMLCN